MTAPDRADPGRGPRLPAAERRRQLLDVALEAFAANGFHVTSMDDIAEAAGVTKPVLYQHFRSKRALYLELLDDVGARLMEAITKATATATGPRQQVEAGFAAYFRFVAVHENAFRLLFGSLARRDEEFSAAVRRVEDSIAEAVADRIDADVDTSHRRLLAYAVVGMAEGASSHVVARRSLGVLDDGAGGRGIEIDPDELARRIAELAWAGLRGVGSS
ncbi:MAG: TetR/AcrR family transcriptional regulator [Actinobacteria bacterium]|nr:MAG: TetR/AcrR family transcriptional regulator [Actinomycetota bacterium]